jgi:hypothetical protein
MRLTSDSMFDSIDSASSGDGDIGQWQLWCNFTQGVTVRARFGYPATRHAAPRFPWLRIRNMTQSREPDDGA